MNKLFFENYRGLKGQIIEINDVNFFVGENSTGKTSVLNLINILSSKEFWINTQFNNSEVEMGYFEEIISQNSQESTFKVGIENILDDKNNTLLKILINFKNKKSVPSIDWIKFSVDELNVFVKIFPKSIKYHFIKQDTQSFEQWIYDEKIMQKSKFKSIHIPMNFPIALLLQFVLSDIKESNKEINTEFDLRFSLLYNHYTWLAPIRAKAKRIYESYNIKFSPEGEHIPSLLRALLSSPKNKRKIIPILEKFGKESNLFDKIEIKELGTKNVAPFEIIIKYNNIPVKLPQVGYGVSQLLPIIIEALDSSDYMFSIQQPEVHLHPKAQAAFGSFIYKSATNDRNKFLIETHSDYTINRYRYSLNSKESQNKPSSQILFFERKEEGNTISQIKISSKGEYISELPISYKEFFIDEELKLLEI
ncbi:AAA family ATPase [Chishuiella changwenlii]|uniref:AAA family ATPase n=1 Tax=Chishuiella changwenlii TaxID=1434701 RepID=UPI002FDA4AF0